MILALHHISILTLSDGKFLALLIPVVQILTPFPFPFPFYLINRQERIPFIKSMLSLSFTPRLTETVNRSPLSARYANLNKVKHYPETFPGSGPPRSFPPHWQQSPSAPQKPSPTIHHPHHPKKSHTTFSINNDMTTMPHLWEQNPPSFIPLTTTLKHHPDDDFLLVANARLQQVSSATMSHDRTVRILFIIPPRTSNSNNNNSITHRTTRVSSNPFDPPFHDQQEVECEWQSLPRHELTQTHNLINQPGPGNFNYLLPKPLVFRLLIASYQAGISHAWFRVNAAGQPVNSRFRREEEDVDVRIGVIKWADLEGFLEVRDWGVFGR